jgi:cytochrome c-type biogenesis protein CcmH
MAPVSVEVDSPLPCAPYVGLGMSDPTNAHASRCSIFPQSHVNVRGPRGASAARESRLPQHGLHNAIRMRLAAPCQGGVRTSVLSAVALLALAAIVLFVLSRSLGPPEEASQRPQAGSNASSGGASLPSDSSGGPTIIGTISVSQELTGSIPRKAVLFVIAHKGAGAPFAVQRIVDPRFPLRYRLGPDDVMMAGAPFEGEVRLSARISRTGSAGPAQPGDLEGERPTPVLVGARDADIVISRPR